MFGGFFKNMVKSADEVLISGIKVGLLADPPTEYARHHETNSASYLSSVCVSHVGSR